MAHTQGIEPWWTGLLGRCLGRGYASGSHTERGKSRYYLGRLVAALVNPWTFLLLGWASVTIAIGWAIGHWRVVVAASIGLLLLGMYGLQTLWVTVKLGLRTLSKVQRKTPDDR